MSHASWVTGEVDPLGNPVHSPDTGRQAPKFLLGKVGGFVQEEPVIALPLVLSLHRRPVPRQVSKFHRRAVAQGEDPVRPVVRSCPWGKEPQQGGNEGIFHLIKFPPHQENLDPWILPGAPSRLPHHRPAFPSAPRPAIAGVFRPAEEERPLGFRIWPPQVNLHRFLHLSPPQTRSFVRFQKKKKTPPLISTPQPPPDPRNSEERAGSAYRCRSAPFKPPL